MSAEEQRARSELAEAQHAYDLGQFDAALKHYSEAYRLKPLPGFLYNIAQCERQLGDASRAAFFYQRYLDLSPNASNAEAARSLLAEMQAKTRAEEKRRAREEATLEAAIARGAIVPANPKKTSPPLVTRWWFWTGVGVVAAGAATGIYFATAPQPRMPSLGTVDAR